MPQSSVKTRQLLPDGPNYKVVAWQKIQQAMPPANVSYRSEMGHATTVSSVHDCDVVKRDFSVDSLFNQTCGK